MTSTTPLARAQRPAPKKHARWLRRMVLLLLLGFGMLNALAWMQARALTSFVPQGQPLQQLREVAWPARLKTLLLGARVPRPQNRHTPADRQLPYEQHSIDLSGQERLEAWYIPHPQPRGIVLLFPGYAVPKDSLLGPAASFYEFGYSSLLVDFRGAGGSTGSDTMLGMREADDVLAAVRYASEHWPDQPLVLYGVSMGSTAILRAVALHAVQPAALILESPFDRLLTTTKRRFTDLGLPAFPTAELLLLWGSLQMGYNGFRHNPADYAALVVSPTLIFHGSQDPWIKPEDVAAIAGRIKGPAQLIPLPGVGHHMPFVHPAPGVWREQVQAFLDAQLNGR